MDSPPLLGEGDIRELDLLRTFETRLWEMDVPVNGIKCVRFGLTGPPYSPTSESSKYSALVSRIAAAGIVLVMGEQQNEQCSSVSGATTLLVERVGTELVDLSIVKLQTREAIFDSPMPKADLDTIVLFMLSYSQWCGQPQPQN